METQDAENIKRNDQIRLLENCAKFTDTEEWKGIFTYPNCGYDLLQQGLVTEDKKITDAGIATLWLLAKGQDPTDSKAVQTFNLNLDNKPKVVPSKYYQPSNEGDIGI